MTELKRKINDSIFGSVSTEELLANAFEKKIDFFGNNITYSPKVFIPLTTMCRDNCGYCTFVKSPKEGGTYLIQEEVLSIAEAGDEAGCYEALFTLGDKPELKWDFALTQLKELGHSSTHDYLISSMKAVNEKFNLFPHANPGLMSRQEIKELKNHSPSGGVMIESFSKNIYDKGKAHYKTDTKYIDLRLDTLNNALEEKYKEQAKEEPHAKRLDPESIKEMVDQLPEPVGYRILVLPFTPREKTKGGILFSQEQLDKARIATTCGYVLKMGDLAYKDEEKFIEPWCKIGDWVMFARYAGARLPIEGGEVRILNDDEVLGTIGDPESILHYI